MCTKLHPGVGSALCCCAQSSTLALCCTYTLYCVIVHKLVAGFAFESDSILFTQPNKGVFQLLQTVSTDATLALLDVQAAVRVSRLSRTATSSTALALAPLHDNLALAPVSPTL